MKYIAPLKKVRKRPHTKSLFWEIVPLINFIIAKKKTLIVHILFLVIKP